MKHQLFLAAAVLCLALSGAHAQGIVEGAEHGARDGARAAGPVGSVVGGVVGGVAGGVSGLLGLDQRPRFREYVIREGRPSYRYSGDLVIGAELPGSGVTYYDVPQEYGVRDYRYTIINGRTVLVDVRTHRVMDVID
jgi:hypothetical protein